MIFISLSLEQLSQCDEVEAYWQVVSPFLWGSIFPAILSMSAAQIIFRILSNILHDI
jgi:hypothetical protein